MSSTHKPPPSADLTLEDSTPRLGKYRKKGLIVLFSLAGFMDSFNVSALFPAVAIISRDLAIKPNETTWLFAAYQATFAAFLLIVSLL